MTEPRQQLAQRRLAQTRLVRAMIEVIQALLDGRMSRADAHAWTVTVRADAKPQRVFDSITTSSVFESLCSIQTAGDDGLVIIRELELRTYLEHLLKGDRFVGETDPLVQLAVPLESLAEQLGTQPVRWWWDQLGWLRELEFCAHATGRPFVAVGGPEGTVGVDIHKRGSDPWLDALVDLFEQLAIDDRDAKPAHPDVDLAQVPAWALWRADDNANRFEMERFRSFAKAERLERLYTERGHKQIYWIEPVA